jgi:hypothetical protein
MATARPSLRKAEDDHPRGECRFLSNRQRCECVSFCANPAVPGACGCGHQQWIHLREPSGKSVSIDDHLALLDKYKVLEDQHRQLQAEIEKAQRDRERADSQLMAVFMKNDMLLKQYCDYTIGMAVNKLEDRLDGYEDQAERDRSKQGELEAFVMRQLDDFDLDGYKSRPVTPFIDSNISSPIHPPVPSLIRQPLPIRTHTTLILNDTWSIRIILIPNRNAPFAPQLDTNEYRRCQTRGMHQDVTVKDKSSDAFVAAVEAKFKTILRSRVWMPLQCLDSQDLSLQTLDASYMKPSAWEWALLETQCMGRNKAYGGEVIFIALKDEVLSWAEIKSLPSSFGSDETCWVHDSELDGSEHKDLMEFTRTSSARDATYSVDYTNSPPPYTSAETPKQRPVTSESRLHFLADISTQQGIYARSTHSAPSISERSIESIESIMSADNAEAHEHRDKRTKHHFASTPSSSSASSTANLPGLAGISPNRPRTGSHTQPNGQAQVIHSGRVKRRITEKSKYREPMDWRPSVSKILGRRPSTSSGPPTGPIMAPMLSPPQVPGVTTSGFLHVDHAQAQNGSSQL